MTGAAWRERRETAGLTLRELARRIGVSAPFQSDVEHGRRRYSRETEAKARISLGMDPLPEPGPRCRVCGGTIADISSQVYLGDPMHMIFGPGSRNQSSTVRHIYCQDCGVQYHHLPAAPPRGAQGGEGR